VITKYTAKWNGRLYKIVSEPITRECKKVMPPFFSENVIATITFT
jgi:hypothetical protein